ncbi:amidohydrolase family protein [Thermogemmatispora sp.]|uniref:amidohydrolase family protein n=1 Tax=Thermogemmatispora sp. TaxID=1968838 RepID=UPI002ACBFD19|nr:amidohydrolase family protein [Thermogemmatispora sp.]
MRIIAIEEHFQIAEINRAVAKWLPARGGFRPVGYRQPESELEDLGAGRLRAMDSMGVDMQVLSYTTVALPALPAAEAVSIIQEINDRLAAAIQAHPERLAGFATLPLTAPEAAARELERTVSRLGFKGAMINGRVEGLFLDDPRFRPVLEAAEALDVPIYLHPAPPPDSVIDACYAGLPPNVTTVFATAGWGWHLETGIHALHLILAGLFDRHPRLKMILGHWGEMIPFYLARVNQTLTPVATHLQRPVADYFLEHFYVTPSGMFTLPPLLLTLQIMGADHILYAVDYPYIQDRQARAFLEQAPLSPADREKIAHGNAERLLKLKSAAQA